MGRDFFSDLAYARLFYGPRKGADEEVALHSILQNTEEELNQKQEKKISTRKYTKFFDVETQKQELTYRRNEEKIQTLLAQTGYFGFLTSCIQLSPQEVLLRYKEKRYGGESL